MSKKKKPDDDLNPEERASLQDPPDRTGGDEPIGENDAELPSAEEEVGQTKESTLDEGEEGEEDPEEPNFAPYHFPPGHKEGDRRDPSDIDPPEDTGNEETLDLNEEPARPVFAYPAIVEVLTDTNDEGKFAGRRRRVLRREARVLTSEERYAIDDEIVESNGEMRRLEVEKAAAVKKYNGEIAEQRQLLDDAIQILRKDLVEFDVERIQKIDEVRWVYTFHDVSTDAIIDEVDIPESERQTEFKF